MKTRSLAMLRAVMQEMQGSIYRNNVNDLPRIYSLAPLS